MDLELSIYEYCAEDDSYTVRGKLEQPPNLDALSTAAERLFEKTIRMEHLNALVIIAGDATIHLHPDGEVVVNGVGSEEAAEKLLSRLFES